ncbi:MAG: outer membrane beta-barrel protein [Bacteroidota bacterium]
MKRKKQNKALTIKRTVFFLLAAFTMNMAVAQEKGFRYGGRFGLGESNMEIEGNSTESGKLAINLGISANYQFTRFFGINADFLLSKKGAGTSGYVTETDFFGNQRNYAYDEQYDLFYGEIPFTVKLSLPLGKDFYLKAYGGSGINFKLAAWQTRTYHDGTYNEENGFFDDRMKGLNTMETPWVYGAGIDVSGKDNRLFFLDFRVNKSMNPIGKINDRDARISYFVISAGYLF